ncbi:MAG TPA: MotA/TolQ/ExbB proton channel family protein [Burkholderiales bacterium]|nr:MotA/TolQ/ExbB proton channel family protein [Burkholderiales bacterium]
MEHGSYGVTSFLAQSDAVGITVLLILLVMSVASWYLILLKAVRGRQMRRQVHDFLEGFWGAPSIDSVAAQLSRATPDNPFARLATQGVEASRHYRKSESAGLAEAGGQAEFLTRAIRRAITRETAGLESGLTVLASVGSTAPFVGLFGTVWGIYHALIGIGQSGAATLDAVAGPVGEALIMTAAGLAVAIPAVLAYNAFSRGNRVVLAELDGFAHDLHAFLITGAKLDSGGFARATPRPVGAAPQAKKAVG